jgi:hypothetical protein
MCERVGPMSSTLGFVARLKGVKADAANWASHVIIIIIFFFFFFRKNVCLY